LEGSSWETEHVIQVGCGGEEWIQDSLGSMDQQDLGFARYVSTVMGVKSNLNPVVLVLAQW
jgi:hypothetical protein